MQQLVLLGRYQIWAVTLLVCRWSTVAKFIFSYGVVSKRKNWLLSGVRCRKIKMLISEMINTATMKTFVQTILSEIILILDHWAL